MDFSRDPLGASLEDDDGTLGKGFRIGFSEVLEGANRARFEGLSTGVLCVSWTLRRIALFVGEKKGLEGDVDFAGDALSKSSSDSDSIESSVTGADRGAFPFFW